MNRDFGQRPRTSDLYPLRGPFDQRWIETGDGHLVYVEQSGTPDGLPVLVVHGGPGGGTSPAMRRFFNPEIYRIIMFDQRGCGRSQPHGSVEANTTWHLVEDMERIRAGLGLETWMLFGGSWGATLSLIYAQTYPERVRALVLRGVFLMTQPELDWFYGGGAGQFWPEAWAKFEEFIPPDERGDLIAAYHRRLFGEDSAQATRAARLWAGWENMLASFDNDAVASFEVPADYARAFARLECHYFSNGGFLTPQTQILAAMDKIAHIPGYIVQGRYDMICPPRSAYRLHQAWPASHLQMVRAGHALSERATASALVRTTDLLGQTL